MFVYYGGIVLEEALDLSSDRILNEYYSMIALWERRRVKYSRGKQGIELRCM